MKNTAYVKKCGKGEKKGGDGCLKEHQHKEMYLRECYLSTSSMDGIGYLEAKQKAQKRVGGSLSRILKMSMIKKPGGKEKRCFLRSRTIGC
jgi:hypothetical protein